MENSIKEYREKELKSFVIGNILLVLISSGVIKQITTITNETTTWYSINTILTAAVFSSVFYIFVFLADSLVSANLKDKIIWCVGGMPGEHVFLDIAEKMNDNRYTREQVKKQFESVYKKLQGKDKNSKEAKNIQNAAWYCIYKEYENHPQISVSQRDYLLCRDMFSIMPFILLGYLCLQLYRGQCISGMMMGIMGIELILLWVITRSKGKRFVHNVISVYIAKNKTEETKSDIILPNS